MTSDGRVFQTFVKKQAGVEGGTGTAASTGDGSAGKFEILTFFVVLISSSLLVISDVIAIP